VAGPPEAATHEAQLLEEHSSLEVVLVDDTAAISFRA